MHSIQLISIIETSWFAAQTGKCKIARTDAQHIDSSRKLCYNTHNDDKEGFAPKRGVY